MAADAKGRSPLMPYAVLVILCLALGIVGMMLKGKADASFDKLEASMQEYEGMVKLRRAALIERPPDEPVVLPRDTPWEDFGGYLPGVASKYGITSQQMPKGFSPMPPSPLPGGGWEARGVMIDLHGTKEAPLEMRSLTLFLDEVERAQPFLKTTSLNLRLTEGNKVSGGGLALQYWLRKP